MVPVADVAYMSIVHGRRTNPLETLATRCKLPYNAGRVPHSVFYLHYARFTLSPSRLLFRTQHAVAAM